MSYNGYRLKELREEWGLSRNQLAAMSEVSASSIYKYETDVQLPGIYQLQKLAKVFETTAGGLLDFIYLAKEG